MKQKLIKLQGKTDRSTIIVVSFNDPFSLIEQADRKAVRSYDLNSTTNQLNRY